MTCHTPHLNTSSQKKSGNPYAVARLFSIFAGLNQKKEGYKIKEFE